MIDGIIMLRKTISIHEVFQFEKHAQQSIKDAIALFNNIVFHPVRPRVDAYDINYYNKEYDLYQSKF